MTGHNDSQEQFDLSISPSTPDSTLMQTLLSALCTENVPSYVLGINGLPPDLNLMATASMGSFQWLMDSLHPAHYPSLIDPLRHSKRHRNTVRGPAALMRMVAEVYDSNLGCNQVWLTRLLATLKAYYNYSLQCPVADEADLMSMLRNRLSDADKARARELIPAIDSIISKLATIARPYQPIIAPICAVDPALQDAYMTRKIDDESILNNRSVLYWEYTKSLRSSAINQMLDDSDVDSFNYWSQRLIISQVKLDDSHKIITIPKGVSPIFAANRRIGMNIESEGLWYAVRQYGPMFPSESTYLMQNAAIMDTAIPDGEEHAESVIAAINLTRLLPTCADIYTANVPTGHGRKRVTWSAGYANVKTSNLLRYYLAQQATKWQ